MARKRYSPKLKSQVVLEALTGEKTPGHIAKQYGVHLDLPSIIPFRPPRPSPRRRADEEGVDHGYHGPGRFLPR